MTDITPTPAPVDVVPLRWSWLTADRRAWLYRGLVVLVGAAVVAGWITSDQALDWLATAAGFLGVAVAAAHTPRPT